MQLPPVRTLGTQLGVSHNAVHRALQVLAQEGIIETQRGIGIRVAASGSAKVPLTFGFVYPYRPDQPYAGHIHVIAEKAINLKNNHYIIKSSYGDPKEEQRAVQQCLESGSEGLILWPCEGEENKTFFQELSSRCPLVFVDRVYEGTSYPSVVMDWSRTGRDIVQHLGQKGFSKILILEEHLEISSYRELFGSMRETVQKMEVQDRFQFAPMETQPFFNLYSRNPETAVTTFTENLANLLAQKQYDTIFSPQDEFLDYIFINTDLATQFPTIKLFSVTSTLPSPRTLKFYQHGVYEWVMNTEAMVSKATEILHDKVFFRSRTQQPIRIPSALVLRASDEVCWKVGERK
jgi:DNA-binding LacI/PurR family transcriptional regulator